MSESFFYCPALRETDARATLTGDEARHVSGARRLRPGDRVTLFDGRGLTATAELVEVRDRGQTVELHVLEHRRVPAPMPMLHLACALPKGDRLSTLLDMGTQLGMSSFTPLQCEHGVVKPGDGASGRWQRIVLEACKQSRRAWLPDLHSAIDPAGAARNAAGRGARVWIAHPDGPPYAAKEVTRNECFLIGPEGGFSDRELTDAETAGASRVGLGEGILRIETAAIALLSAARFCGR